MELINEKVYVYRNLHKKCYSVKSLRTGKVIAHVDDITLINVQFKVSPAGRERVLRERRKNVHAGVVGYVARASMLGDSIRVMYNPYKFSGFVRKDESIIKSAAIAFIDSSGIIAIE